MTQDLQGTRNNFHETRTWGAFLVAGYILLVAMPLLLAYSAQNRELHGLTTEFALAAGLAAFTILSLQPLLAARLRWMERPFGLDRLLHFHRTMAVVAVLLLLAHPLLLAAGHGNWSLVTTPGMPWPIQLGRLALLMAVFGGAVALLRRTLPLDYNRWRTLHKSMVFVPLLALVHSLIVGDDLENPGLQAYWFALLGLCLFGFGWRNFYLPFWGARTMRVAEVKPESDNATTLVLDPEDGKPFRHHPGQFWFLRLQGEGHRAEEHPFTIASSPEAPLPCSTIQHAGNFTKTIPQTRVGDRARVLGPYGRFSTAFHAADAYVFIAGGIGITPLMSMLRHLRDTGDEREALLLWGNHEEADLLFRDELEQMPAHLRTVHTLTEPPKDWTGATGRITKEMIAEHAAALLPHAQLFVCGPPPMMDAIVGGLEKLGVAKKRIHTERFSL